jgi:transcription elongation factor GreA
MTPVDALLKHARVGNMNALEDAWLALLSEDDLTHDSFVNYIPVLESLASEAGKSAEAEALATIAMETLQERFAADQLLASARALMLTFRQSAALREIGCSIYRKAYAGRPGLERLIEQSGLAGARPARRATQMLDVCLALEEGTALLGRSGEEVAIVEAIDRDTWQITLKTPKGSDSLAPMDVADTFSPAPPDDFRVLKAFDPLAYAELMASQPVAVIRRILQTRERKMTEWALEEYLTPAHVARKDWKAWFTKARSQIRQVPDISIEGRNPYVLVYDPLAATSEAKAWRDFGKVRGAGERLSVIEDYLRECKARKAGPDQSLLLKMAQQMETFSNKLKANRGYGDVETLLVASRARAAAGEAGPFPLLVELLRVIPNPLAEIHQITNVNLRRLAFDALEVSGRDDVVELFEQLLMESPLSMCDALADCLERLGYTPARFAELAQRVFTDAVRCGSALAWLWSEPDNPHLAGAVDPRMVFNRILWMMSEIKRRDNLDNEALKRIKADVRSSLSSRNFARFRDYIEALDKPLAAALYQQISWLENLGRASQEDLQTIISTKFPNLHEKKAVNPWEDETTLYCTPKGLQVKEAEITEMVNVKMLENARAIGRAAEHGDLSENSEFKFALEERDLLRARLAKMNEEHGLAKVLEPADVPTDTAGIGSAITVRDLKTGEVKRFVILGPWEADANKGILNYKTPLAQAMMGARVGDKRTMNFRGHIEEFTIEKLENALIASQE